MSASEMMMLEEELAELRAEVERLRERCLEQEAEACGRMGHRDGLSRDRGPFGLGGQLDAAWRRGWDERNASVAEVEQLRSENRKLRDVLEWVNVQCPGKCSGVCDAALRSGYHDKEKQ